LGRRRVRRPPPSAVGPRSPGAQNIDGCSCQAQRARICSQFAQWLSFRTLISADRTPEFAAGLAKTQAALAYAGRLHEGQLRAGDGAPFIVHPIEVGMLLNESGAADEVIAAGVLHDTLEKTDATAYDIYARFGRRVGDMVCAVSHDPAIPGYTRRKAALREQVANAGEDALTVFAADKLSKVRELRVGDRSGIKVRSRKLRHYRLSLAMLQKRLPDSSLVAALAAELDALSDGRDVSARSE
jgi:(p)ppGpp synthase/HD superfamily hydrolase